MANVEFINFDRVNQGQHEYEQVLLQKLANELNGIISNLPPSQVNTCDFRTNETIENNLNALADVKAIISMMCDLSSYGDSINVNRDSFCGTLGKLVRDIDVVINSMSKLANNTLS